MYLDYANVESVLAGEWLWPNFTPEEFACKVTGRVRVHIGFMNRLQSLRNRFGAPMIITSGFRAPSRGAGSAHAEGRAADVHVYGSEAYQLIGLAMRHGFTGIGVGQKLGTPVTRRFIHLDDVENSPIRPRPLIWSYEQ